MLAAITRMISDPKESWYVKSGALMALKLAPAKDIEERKKLIQPWIKHSDWWMREAAFFALSGLAMENEESAQRIAAVRMVGIFMISIQVHGYQFRSESFKPSITQSTCP